MVISWALDINTRLRAIFSGANQHSKPGSDGLFGRGGRHASVGEARIGRVARCAFHRIQVLENPDHSKKAAG